VRTIFGGLAAVVLGALGWRLGRLAGPWAAVAQSARGAGAGLYYGRRLHDQWLD
jgi:hypothetical protein